MVSLLNGSLSDEDNKKRPLENGHCGLVKYKPRRVSAVRDFPPGCGRDVPRINVNPLETTVALVVSEKVPDVVDAHGAKTSETELESGRDMPRINVNPLETKVALVIAEKVPDVVEADDAKTAITSNIELESVSHEAARSPVQFEMANSLDGLVGKVVDKAEMVDGGEVLATGVLPLGISLPNIAQQFLEDSNEVEKEVLVKEGETQALVKEEPCDGEVQVLVTKKESKEAEVQPFAKEELHKVEAQAMVVTKTESKEAEVQPFEKEELHEVEVQAMVKNACGPEHKSVLEIGDQSDVATLLGGEKSWSPPQWHISDVNIPEGTSPKNKYTRRRVSATRDFPPFCGRNAPQPTREDRVRINSGKKSLGAVEKDGVESGVLRETLKDVVEGGTSRVTARAGGEELEGKVRDGNTQKSESMEIVPESSQNPYEVIRKSSEDDGGLVEKVGQDIVVYSHEESLDKKISGDAVDLGGDLDSMIMQGLMAASCVPLRQGKEALTSPHNVMSRSKAKKRDFTGQEKSKLGSKTNNSCIINSGGKLKKKSLSARKAGYGGICDLVIKDEEDYVAHNEEKNEVSPAGRGPLECDVTLPPFGPNSSTLGDARNRVRESLRLFQAICRKILQGEEAKSRQGEQAKSNIKRIDLVAAKIVKERGKEVNTDKKILGKVPGVEVGDEFQYRVELAIVGIHRLYQGGIDYVKLNRGNVAASIVASGGYADELDNADVLIYSGQGGNVIGKDKQPEDQKLERGNLALKNSISEKNPVRVIRGSKETKAADSVDARGKVVMTYVYDGLYTVDRYWQEVGPHGKLVFKFELRRIPGQPELAWKEVKKSRKSKTRDGLCVDDISGGKEVIPICAVNTIDDEKPPPFSYINRMIYPDQHLPIPPKGCDCKGGCLDSWSCSCAAKNGEIPYNFNGAIVEMKPLVYECGPSCKCPPSCYNRVSQHGIKFQLEIFKTESRGWGVRSLNSILAGSFICEYTGELLEDREAEKRSGNDEYLFDIGQNYNDCSLNPDAEASSSKVVERVFTIDAAQCGNVGRFINHSCSPNLYAQNVLYDHEDKRMPHIMLFAAENIPPLQELTYHYNYSVDQVHDSDGNIKMKSCYCGSAGCTGRMY